MPRLLILSLLTLGCLIPPDSLFAQGRQTGGGGGAGGGNRQATGGLTGGRATGAGPTAAGRGQGTGGANAAAGIDTAAGTSAAIVRDFAGEFIGQGDSTGQFVGNENAGPQQLNQQTPNFQQRQGTRTQGGKPTRESQVRPVLRIGFDSPNAINSASPTAMSTFDTQLSSKLERQPRFAGVTLVRSGEGDLVLQGTVASEQSRKLAEAYLRLEPGVRSVDNRLIVQPQ